MPESPFERALRDHDAALRALGLEIWAGTEPTFTDRFSEAPEWLFAALGEAKSQRAEALLRVLHARLGGVVLRSVGRQYPGEERPRWSLGLYGRRDGEPLWSGPPDPAFGAPATGAPDLRALQALLAEGLAARGYTVRSLKGPNGDLRLLAHPPDHPAPPAPDDDRLRRPTLHDRPLPPRGLTDDLAGERLWLFVIDALPWQGGPVGRVELPACEGPVRYGDWLQALGEAARTAGLDRLLLTGHPPPVDASVWWTTITPDPAVIEVNAAPCPDAASLLAASRTLYSAAAGLGLSPYRLYYNGTVADSGGGGQITLGGPSPEASPFFRVPQLLPRLLRYTHQHPALSYLFAHDHLGASGQAVRTDERGRDGLRELGLALALLERDPAPTPEALWSGLAQFLTDATGNSHRAELNIEKLWNPFLPGRGRQGLVEFRALRMQHTPERVAALVALLRAVVAMLARGGLEAPLRDWGDALHERFALPYYLERDLEAVLADLEAAGLGLGPALTEALRRDEFRYWAQVDHAGCRLTIRRAVEFWPLVGDASGQDHGTSRLVDASTTRLELCLRPGPGARAEEDFEGWQLAVAGRRVPLRPERDAQGPARLIGLRFRSFVPWLGLHPSLPAQGPVPLLLFHPSRAEALSVTLHEWRPDNEPYAGLPADPAEAAARREARCVVEPAAPPGALPAPEPEALSAYTLDLRWLAARPA